MKTAGRPFRAFAVVNLGRYERQAYLNVGGRLTGKKKEQALARKEREFRDLILKAYRAEPLGGGSFVGSAPASGAVSGALAGNWARTTTDSELPNEFSLTPAPASARARMPAREARALPDSFFHGKTGGRRVVVDPSNLPINRLFVEELIMKFTKNKDGIVKREILTKKWTDWVDYWAVDCNYESRKEIIKMAKTMGVDGELPGTVDAASGEFLEFEGRWTGAYIFENEWQSFRTRRDRDLEMTSVSHTYPKPGQAGPLHRRHQSHRYFRKRHHDIGAGECGVIRSAKPAAVVVVTHLEIAT